MKSIFKLSLVIIFLGLIFCPVFANNPNETIVQNSQEEALKSTERFKQLNDSICGLATKITQLEKSLSKVSSEINNYEIEKNLLQETYKTNYNTVNVIASFISIFITIVIIVLGFFGFSSIREVKKNFQNDMDDLTLRFNTEIEEMKRTRLKNERRLSAARKRDEELSRTNHLQTERILLIEGKQRIDDLIDNGNFKVADAKIIELMKDFPNDLFLLAKGSLVKAELFQFDLALKYGKRAYEIAISEGNENVADNVQKNLLEIMVLSKKFNLYGRYINQYKTKDSEKALVSYLEALRCLMQGDINEMKDHIKSHLSLHDVVIPSWTFGFVRKYISLQGIEQRFLFFQYLNIITTETHLKGHFLSSIEN